jgi:hypothetical protein
MARRLGMEKRTTWIPHIDAADLVAPYQAAGRWFSLLYMKVSACRLKPFITSLKSLM